MKRLIASSRKKTERYRRTSLLPLAIYPEYTESLRPKTRQECHAIERPCPFVSCKYHLYLDPLERKDGILFNFPDLDVDEITETCCLDAADRGGMTLDDIGRRMNLTRERVRQVEVMALQKLVDSGAIEEVE